MVSLKEGEDTDTHRQKAMKTEAETRIMLPQVKQKPGFTKKLGGKERCFLGSQREHDSINTLISASRTVRVDFCFFQFMDCVGLLQQP